eukprot:5744447-Amphidinium_carterae.1
MDLRQYLFLYRFLSIDDVPGGTVSLPRQPAGFGLCKAKELLRGLLLTGLEVFFETIPNRSLVVPQVLLCSPAIAKIEQLHGDWINQTDLFWWP